MDNLVFEESINTEVSSSEFVDKQWLYVNDNNNSSYSSQIVLDTTPLANAGGYIGWMESFLAIPLVLQVESAALTSASAPNLDWFLGMKNGYWNILHSLTCEFNNGNIIQQVPFLNVFCSFKALTSWCDADVVNWGAVCGFCPDSSRSWLYNNVAPASTNQMYSGGSGVCNNRICGYTDITSFVEITTTAPVFTGAGPTDTSTDTAYTPAGTISAPASTSAQFNMNGATCCFKSVNDFRCWSNEGLKKRIEYLNFGTTLNTGGIVGDTTNNQSALLGSTTQFAQSFQSYIQRGAGYRAIVFDSVVRLKDIADFFCKCPLLKGSTMRLYLNTNQVYFEGAVLAPVVGSAGQTNAAQMGLTSPPIILGGGGTNPVMVASNDIGQGASPLDPALTALGDPVAYKVGLSIVRTQFTQLATTISAPITSCRLYAPCYTMSPIAEQRYLSLTPTKKVLYEDIFQYSFNGIGAGQTFNLLVSNGIPNIRSVLVVPLLAQAQNGVGGTITGATTNATAITSNTLLSPFSTTGGTPDPISLTNFNIQISGKNLFINNQQYNFETFVEQLVSSNQLNGSLTTSLGSGQVSYEDFQSLYRYYYGNVSRSIPSEDGVAKAVQLLGVNNSLQEIGLMVFVSFEREITIDVRTGARVM
jgi:hypothetical protein